MPLDNSLFVKLLETRQSGFEQEMARNQAIQQQRQATGKMLMEEVGAFTNMRRQRLKDQMELTRFQLEMYGKAGVPAEQIDMSKLAPEAQAVGTAAYLGGAESRTQNQQTQKFRTDQLERLSEQDKATAAYREEELKARRDIAGAQKTATADRFIAGQLAQDLRQKARLAFGEKMIQETRAIAASKYLNPEVVKLMNLNSKDARSYDKATEMIDSLLTEVKNAKTNTEKMRQFTVSLQRINTVLNGGDPNALGAEEAKRLKGALETWGWNGTTSGLLDSFRTDTTKISSYMNQLAKIAQSSHFAGQNLYKKNINLRETGTLDPMLDAPGARLAHQEFLTPEVEESEQAF